MTSGAPRRSLPLFGYHSFIYTVIAKLFTDNIVIDKMACAERARGESRFAESAGKGEVGAKSMTSIEKLAHKFSRLPGVGAKTAMRYAYAVVSMSEAEAAELAGAITDVKKNVRYCPICGNFTEDDVCEICRKRDPSVICVVTYPKDVAAMEKAHAFRGVYHVLHGTISPLEGRGPDDIRVKELLARLNGVKEVILATNPDVEGEATAMYIARIVKPLGIKVTRLAQGISMGSDIEYADEVTLSRALESRVEL